MRDDFKCFLVARGYELNHFEWEVEVLGVNLKLDDGVS